MRTIAIAKKVIKELLRDKRTLALMFVAPVFIMWLMNLMFSASTTVTVKLATQDVPSSLVSRMDDLEHVSVKTYKDLDQAKEALNDGKVDAVISYKDGEYHVAYANTDASKTSVTRQVLRTSIASEDTNQLLARVKQSDLPSSRQRWRKHTDATASKATLLSACWIFSAASLTETH